MFESFQDNGASRRARVISIVLGIAALTVALLAYSFHGSPRSEPPEASDLAGALPSLPPPSPVKIELPGMSIEAPSYAAVTGDYVTGSAQATSPFEWAVTWQRGPLPPIAALQSIVDGMIRALAARRMSPAHVTSSRESALGGAPGRTFELASENGSIYVVVFGECGGRVVQILGGGLGNARETTTAMVDSFRCKPDATRDLDRAAVAVEARPGWRRTAATGQPMLVNARELVVRPTVIASTDPGALEQFAPTAIRAGGFTVGSDVPQERAGRKVWFGSASLSGKPRPAAFVVWRCADDARVAAVYVVSMEGAPLDDGIALALTGRCLGPDEKAPDYPVKGAK